MDVRHYRKGQESGNGLRYHELLQWEKDRVNLWTNGNWLVYRSSKVCKIPNVIVVTFTASSHLTTTKNREMTPWGLFSTLDHQLF